MKNHNFVHTDALFEAFVKWIKEHAGNEEFKKFKVDQIAYILSDGLDHKGKILNPPIDFHWNDSREQESLFILSFLRLRSAIEIFSQTQYYFRRFPFHGLPISKADHCSNMCNLYFNNFYLINERLKVMLNKYKDMSINSTLDIVKTKKSFYEKFREELKRRNNITHTEPFDDLGLHKLSITGVISSNGGKEWSTQHSYTYRKFCQEWSRRTEKRSIEVQDFINIIAEIILANVLFSDPD